MKTKYLSMALLIITLSFVACATKIQQNNTECYTDSTINVNKEFDKELIISLIKKDEERRHIWSYDFKQSVASPMFYEALCDEGLYLYRVAIQNQKTFVIMLEDTNIGMTEDFIVIDSLYCKDGIGYEHNGYYEIIDDSTVNVAFEKWWSNYCHTCDSCEYEFTYHIKCTHSYKFLNMEFERIKADTIVVIDERPLFCCKDIWEYTE